MFNYEGIKCPYCGEPLHNQDDIAVCPDCGTPHHRTCFIEQGQCANAVLHSELYEWENPNAAQNPVPVSGKDYRCPNCGSFNNQANVFCTNCGSPISANTGDSYAHQEQQQQAFPPFVGGQAYSADQIYTKDSKIDDIPVSEWITYIGNSAPYYLYSFKTQDKLKRKTALTWSAMFFPSLYFLYRRVWGMGILAAVLQLIINIPYAVIVLLNPYFGIDFGLSAVTWDNLFRVSSGLSLVVSLFFALYAVWLYRKNSAKHMKRLKDTSATHDEYLFRLQKTSGPSKIVLIVVGALWFVLFAYLTMFAGISVFL